MRFLHTADWQLGMGRRFLDRERQGQFDAARRDVLGTLGRLAVSEGCEAIVVGGDVFETNPESARTVRQAMEKLRGLPLKVFLLPGNHDPLNAARSGTPSGSAQACPDNVVVLRDETPVEVRPGLRGGRGAVAFQAADLGSAGRSARRPWTRRRPGWCGSRSATARWTRSRRRPTRWR